MDVSDHNEIMPKIITTTDVFEEGYPAEIALTRLAALGYEGIDMGFDYWTFEGSPFADENYLDWAKGLKAASDSLGVPYTHAHAPADIDNAYWLERSIRASEVLGAKYLVVHPIFMLNGSEIEDKETFISVNAAATKKFLPLAEECGVVLLSENILCGASGDPRIIADLAKTVDSKYFGWCFDSGHAYAKGFASSILAECSVCPLSVHIQDSLGNDDHLIPGDGKINWENYVDDLKAAGYKGDCVLEAHHQSLYAADNERDEILSRLLLKAEEIRAAMCK